MGAVPDTTVSVAFTGGSEVGAEALRALGDIDGLWTNVSKGVTIKIAKTAYSGGLACTS